MRALSFGEVLWDIDGNVKTLGGAPLNVLGHISRLGGDSSIISAVGDDALGMSALKIIESFGIDRRFLGLSKYPTGKAMVELDNGIPSYTFNDPCAWDDINLDAKAKEMLSKEMFDVFIYGTLASRHETSRATLLYLLENIEAKVFFFDVNIRLSFYDDEIIKKGISKATILKVNEDEVSIVADALGIPERDFPVALQKEYPVNKVLITLGKKGSVCYEGTSASYAGVSDVPVIDTVGAGDSLSAAFLYFINKGEGTDEALSKASLLADYVVSKRGAIPEYDDTIRAKLEI